MKLEKFLIFIFVAIIALGFSVYFRFQKLKKDLNVKLPEFQMPETIFSPQGKIEEKEFQTPDAKLKFRYTSDWVVGQEELLRFFKPTIKEMETIFVAYRISDPFNTFPSFLILQEAFFESEEKIIKEMEEGIRKKGSQMKILKKEKKEKETILEIEYENKTGEAALSFYSKEKIIKGDNKFYLISVFSPKENWEEILPLADKILESVEIID